MKLRGKAKARVRQKARGRQAREKSLTWGELYDLMQDCVYTEKAWEPLPDDADNDTKRLWALIKPPGAPQVPGYPEPLHRPAGWHLPGPGEGTP
jgi:hypothetical protein